MSKRDIQYSGDIKICLKCDVNILEHTQNMQNFDEQKWIEPSIQSKKEIEINRQYKII
jgi:hypothetical protein